MTLMTNKEYCEYVAGRENAVRVSEIRFLRFCPAG